MVFTYREGVVRVKLVSRGELLDTLGGVWRGHSKVSSQTYQWNGANGMEQKEGGEGVLRIILNGWHELRLYLMNFKFNLSPT